MTNKWILDVLADLRAFAEANDMPRLADQLEVSAIVAAAEMVSVSENGAPDVACGDGAEVGTDIRAIAGRRTA